MENMYRIWTVFKPFKLDDVAEALVETRIGEFTVTEVRGMGRQKSHTELYRGSGYSVDFMPKVELEVVVAGGIWRDKAIAAIERSAKTGSIGDGKIFVEPVDSGVNVKDGTPYNPVYPQQTEFIGSFRRQYSTRAYR